MPKLANAADSILNCAQSLMIAGGYNGFSYADIAKVVGIRNASIHHHFPGKADLVRALVKRYREDAETAIAEAARHVPDPCEQLQAYAGYWEQCIVNDTSAFCLCALLATEMPVLPDEVGLEVKAYFRGLSAWLAGVFERGAAAGRIRLSGAAAVEAEIFMASVHGAMLSARAYGDPAMFGLIVRPVLGRLMIQD